MIRPIVFNKLICKLDRQKAVFYTKGYMMDIQLNFINQSNDINNSSVVIFQKNVADEFGGPVIAWKVIPNSAPGDRRPFVFPVSPTISASDSFGNYFPQLTAKSGQMFQVVNIATGRQIIASGAATSDRQIQLRNNLPSGAINASIYKNGKLLAAKTSVAPDQKASFEFKPTIWIGVASQLIEGEVMNADILSSINTEISLLGIKSADIVMTGGGSGASSQPYQFSLDNIVMA